MISSKDINEIKGGINHLKDQIKKGFEKLAKEISTIGAFSGGFEVEKDHIFGEAGKEMDGFKESGTFQIFKGLKLVYVV